MKKADSKQQTDYWILEQTWNRNIVRGPYSDYGTGMTLMGLRETETAAYMSDHGGGPVRLTLLKAVASVRVVRKGLMKFESGRKAWVVGSERSGSGNVRTAAKKGGR